MANHGYMTVNGKSQGLISANFSTQDYDQIRRGLAKEWECFH
jgi:hypothetical protein